jgi:hypothetical protein
MVFQRDDIVVLQKLGANAVLHNIGEELEKSFRTF